MLDLSRTVGAHCVLHPAALDPRLCTALVQRLEAAGFDDAVDRYPRWYRSNQRRVLDDAHLAHTLEHHLAHLFPGPLTVEGQSWAWRGINPRLRACRYLPGQTFRIHQDGVHHAADGAQSLLTFMVYLDGPESFQGGQTRFFSGPSDEGEPLAVVHPRTGDAIIFDHRLWHDGAVVTSGVKHVLRSDLMYQPRNATVGHRHRGYIWRVRQGRDGVLVSGGRDATLRQWRETPEGWNTFEVLSGHQGSVMDVAQDTDGTWWSTGRDGTVRQWRDGLNMQTVALPMTTGTRVVHTQGGLCVAGNSGALCHLEPTCGDAARSVPVHDGWVWGLAALQKGTWLSAGDDGVAISTREGILLKRNLGSPAHALAMDGAGAAWVGLRNGDAVKVACTDLTVLARVPIHHGAVTDLQRSQGLLWSAGEDGAVRAWDARTMQCVAHHHHENFVRSVAVLHDGRTVSAGYDGVLRTWSAIRRNTREPHGTQEQL